MSAPIANADTSQEGNPPAGAGITPPITEPIPGLGDAGKAAIDRMKAERDAALAERAETAAKLKEFEDKNLSDLERLTRDRDEATAKLNAIQPSVLRYEVALDLGVPKNLVGRLQGSTREELEADATSLLELLNIKPIQPAPQPIPGQGARPDSQQSDKDAEYEAYFPSQPRK